MAMAWTMGESNGSWVGSATISFSPVPRLSTTPFKSKLPSVKVPVLENKVEKKYDIVNMLYFQLHKMFVFDLCYRHFHL